ncbi:hypothetical protein H0H93_006412, partial [Arthromyces matolae]
VYCVAAWNTFVVPHVDGEDDMPSLVQAIGNYTANSTILFEKGVHYNIFSPIKFPVLNNVEIRIEGNLSYPTDIAAIQGEFQYNVFIVNKRIEYLPFRCSTGWQVCESVFFIFDALSHSCQRDSLVIGNSSRLLTSNQRLTRLARIAFTGGNNVTLRGSTDPEWGWIDGQGQAWWDTQNQVNRPNGIAFSKISNGVIRDMKIWKVLYSGYPSFPVLFLTKLRQPIAHNFATSGATNLHVFNNKILAASSNPNVSAFPFNTYVLTPPFLRDCKNLAVMINSDGFSAGGTNQLFENNYVVNGDDCLTVGNGAKNIHFRNSYCEGGHGLSIGSLGSGGSVADVENVLIENVFMKDSLYGARFKSWTGGNGFARNVTWKNIAFDNVRMPIYVTQNYWDQDTGPKPNSTTVNNTHVEDFLFQNFVGTINDDPNYFEGSCVSDPCWYYVANATGREVVIFDLYPNT